MWAAITGARGASPCIQFRHAGWTLKRSEDKLGCWMGVPMAKLDEDYEWVEVESFLPDKTSGLHGKVHVRPLPGQRFPTDLHVECGRKLRKDYPVGTRFRVLGKLTDREGGGEYLYSSWQWKYEVLWRPDQPT